MIPEKAKQKGRTKTERQEPAINPHFVAQGRTRFRASSEPRREYDQLKIEEPELKN